LLWACPNVGVAKPGVAMGLPQRRGRKVKRWGREARRCYGPTPTSGLPGQTLGSRSPMLLWAYPNAGVTKPGVAMGLPQRRGREARCCYGLTPTPGLPGQTLGSRSPMLLWAYPNVGVARSNVGVAKPGVAMGLPQRRGCQVKRWGREARRCYGLTPTPGSH
jgi:hypothetical protein